RSRAISKVLPARKGFVSRCYGSGGSWMDRRSRNISGTHTLCCGSDAARRRRKRVIRRLEGPMEKLPMTSAGYARLEDELKHRQQVEWPRIIQQITDARTHG